MGVMYRGLKGDAVGVTLCGIKGEAAGEVLLSLEGERSPTTFAGDPLGEEEIEIRWLCRSRFFQTGSL